MKYTSCILALQICVILSSSTFYCEAVCRNEIYKLKAYFNASSSDVADGGPLFLDILKNWREESDKAIIASQIMSFYAKLFNNYKDHQTIQSSIDIMREHMFMKFFSSFNSSDTKKHDFEKLIDLQVNDLTVQRKAVSELCHVVEDLWPTSSQRKRKRSQIQFRGRRASK